MGCATAYGLCLRVVPLPPTGYTCICSCATQLLLAGGAPADGVLAAPPGHRSTPGAAAAEPGAGGATASGAQALPDAVFVGAGGPTAGAAGVGATAAAGGSAAGPQAAVPGLGSLPLAAAAQGGHLECVQVGVLHLAFARGSGRAAGGGCAWGSWHLRTCSRPCGLPVRCVSLCVWMCVSLHAWRNRAAGCA